MTADPPRTMVPLTALTGVPVRDATGRRAGWVRDVVASVSPRGAQVTGLVLGDLRGRWIVPWSDLDVSRLDHFTLTHPVAREARQSIPLETDELLLVRDVLDCSVYVASQRQTARVGEVWLEPSEGTTLSVAGVEVGVGVVLRRLVPRRRRSVSGVRLLRLGEVHLFSGRGHIVQLATDASPAPHLTPPDLAHLLTHLPSRLAVDVLRRVPCHAVEGRRRAPALPGAGRTWPGPSRGTGSRAAGSGERPDWRTNGPAVDEPTPCK